MKVLVACEFSGVVRDAFRAKGHDAWSCDLLDTESNSRYHIKQSVLEHALLNEGWDLMIAHPPCTYLANSGVRWLYNKDGSRAASRWVYLKEACNFFMELYNAPIPRICLENPIQHGYARKLIPIYQQCLQPWNFKDDETKAVCLWLKNLPPLVRQITKKPKNLKARVHHLPPSPERQKERSRFFPGIANAMAEQWGDL